METSCGCVVIDITFAPGSVNVEYVVEVPQNTTQEKVQLSVTNAIREGEFLPEGSNFTIDSDNIVIGDSKYLSKWILQNTLVKRTWK